MERPGGNAQKTWRPSAWGICATPQDRAARTPWIRRGAGLPSDKGLNQAGRRARGGATPSPKAKILNSRKEGIEDCTRFSWSSRRRPGRVAQPQPSIYRQVFWLLDRPTPGAFPGRSSTPVAFSRFRPQSQRRDRDGFAPSSPLTPVGPVSVFYSIPICLGCQGKSRRSGRIRRRCAPPPGPEPQGSIWPGAGTRPGGRPGDSWFRSVPCPWPR